MNYPYYNDQAYIAGSYSINEEYISQTSRLAQFKINSYKLSVIKASFCKTKEELESNLRNSLFNYIESGELLADLGFFMAELDN